MGEVFRLPDSLQQADVDRPLIGSDGSVGVVEEEIPVDISVSPHSVGLIQWMELGMRSWRQEIVEPSVVVCRSSSLGISELICAVFLDR